MELILDCKVPVDEYNHDGIDAKLVVTKSKGSSKVKFEIKYKGEHPSSIIEISLLDAMYLKSILH